MGGVTVTSTTVCQLRRPRRVVGDDLVVAQEVGECPARRTGALTLVVLDGAIEGDCRRRNRRVDIRIDLRSCVALHPRRTTGRGDQSPPEPFERVRGLN